MADKENQKTKWGIITLANGSINKAVYYLDDTIVSSRLAKGLINNNLTSWDSIKEIDENKLLRTINFSKVSLAELKEVCRSKGINFDAPVLRAHSWRKIEYCPKDRDVVLYPDDRNPTHWIDKPT